MPHLHSFALVLSGLHGIFYRFCSLLTWPSHLLSEFICILLWFTGQVYWKYKEFILLEVFRYRPSIKVNNIFIIFMRSYYDESSVVLASHIRLKV